MKTLTIGAVLLFGCTALAAPAFAGPVGVEHLSADQQAAVVDRLHTTKAQLAEKADLQNARGPLRIAYMERQDRINDLVNRLQSGQPVSVNAINHVTQPVNGETAM
jgi:hypothetical protein